MTNILKDTSLSHIRSLQHVVILKDSATVEQVLRVRRLLHLAEWLNSALQTLASHRLVSAPVVRDVPIEESHHGPTWPMSQPPNAVAGFVDVKSIIKKFLEDIKDTDILEMRSMLRRMRALEQQGMVFSRQTIKDHDLLTGDGSFLHVDQEKLSLLELASEALLGSSRRVSSMAERPNVVHRIAIFDARSRIVNIISQSDIVRYLLDHHAELGEVGHKTIGELGFGRIKIISVTPELSAIEALKVMNEKKIGAVAVVNSKGQIIGNFSAADMRHPLFREHSLRHPVFGRTITPEHFGSLALPVGEFLALEHGVEYAGYAIPRQSADSSSSGDDTERRLDRGKSVDFLRSKEPVGTVSERSVLQFARGTVERTRPSLGSDVGQNLIICSMENTLIDVLRLLSLGRVHRVFIVDEEDKPIGVITCTDILRTLVDIYK